VAVLLYTGTTTDSVGLIACGVDMPICSNSLGALVVSCAGELGY
jgi:hypothetical protein